MPGPQIIETPKGERMVVLPLKEYKRLRDAAENLDDVRAFDEAKRRLTTGEDELIPAKFADRIFNGESPVRVWRNYRGLSVKELAKRAKISAAYLSQIEGGSREGSISTMKALAATLSLEIDDLV